MTAEDYYYVDKGSLARIKIDETTLPNRTGSAAFVVRGEDIAFLGEAVKERENATAETFDGDKVKVDGVSSSQIAGILTKLNNGGRRLHAIAISSSAVLPDLIYGVSGSGDDCTTIDRYIQLVEAQGISLSVTLDDLVDPGPILESTAILDAFNNEKKLTRFAPRSRELFYVERYLVDRRRETFGRIVESSTDAYKLQTDASGHDYPYPNDLDGEYVEDSITEYEDKVTLYMKSETTTYTGRWDLVGRRLTTNRWNSNMVEEWRHRDINIFRMPSNYYIPDGIRVRPLFRFKYSQRFASTLWKNGESGRTADVEDEMAVQCGFALGGAMTKSSGWWTLYGTFWYDRIDLIKSACGRTPRHSYCRINNLPEWHEMTDVTPGAYINTLDYRDFSRSYDERIEAEFIGYIVELGNHTKWWS